MISTDDENYQEFHFLSACYGEGINDKKVYTLFITKVLADLQVPINIPISKLEKHILDRYGIEIPPTFIREIIDDMDKMCGEFSFKRDILHLQYMPNFIIENTKEQQKLLDSDSSLIFTELTGILF
jgi:hypothetical protein